MGISSCRAGFLPTIRLLATWPLRDIGFWLTTRHATPQQSTKIAIQDFARLIQHQDPQNPKPPELPKSSFLDPSCLFLLKFHLAKISPPKKSKLAHWTAKASVNFTQVVVFPAPATAVMRRTRPGSGWKSKILPGMSCEGFPKQIR